MTLVRSILYEEFQNEQFECILWWRKALDKQNEINCKNLKHQRVSLEAEHVQNQTEVEYYYNMQVRRNSIDIDNLQRVLNRNSEKKIAFYDAKLNEIDKKFSEKCKKILVYKKKLEIILNGYIDFIENSFKKQSQILPKEKLFQAKSLMIKIKNIVIENHKEREQTPCTNDTICIKRKTSYEL
jgi:Fe-S cluster assembly iron-binding protein IscA